MTIRPSTPRAGDQGPPLLIEWLECRRPQPRPALTVPAERRAPGT